MKCQTLLDHGFCAACYAARRGREAGHRKLPRLPAPVFNPFEESDVAMKRPAEGAVQSAGQPATDPVFAGFYPTLHGHLTETVWEDGKPRKTSTLLLMTENGRWKAFFHDRDLKRGFWVTGDAYEGVLGVLEESIESSSTEWRKDTR